MTFETNAERYDMEALAKLIGEAEAMALYLWCDDRGYDLERVLLAGWATLDDGDAECRESALASVPGFVAAQVESMAPAK